METGAKWCRDTEEFRIFFRDNNIKKRVDLTSSNLLIKMTKKEFLTLRRQIIEALPDLRFLSGYVLQRQEQIVRIANLIFMEDLYPRHNTDWMTICRYAEAMATGSVFPPIEVGRIRGDLHVVDGWHRCQAAQRNGEEYIQAHISNFEDERSLFEAAVRANITHGRQLTPHDRVRIIGILEDYEYTPVEISNIVMIPVERLERWTHKYYIRPDGQRVAFKGIIANQILEGRLTVEQALEVQQDSFNTRLSQNLLTQLIALLEDDALPNIDSVHSLAIRAYNLLGEYL